MPPIRKKGRMVQISTRVSKSTLVKLEIIIAEKLMSEEFIDRNKLTRKIIEKFVNSKENQQLIVQFRKNHSTEYKQILEKISKIKK